MKYGFVVIAVDSGGTLDVQKLVKKILFKISYVVCNLACKCSVICMFVRFCVLCILMPIRVKPSYLIIKSQNFVHELFENCVSQKAFL